MNEDMRTYCYDEMESFIWDLENAVETIRERNENLMDRKSEVKMRQVVEFMREHESHVDAQTSILTDLSCEIHELLCSIAAAEEKEEVYQGMLDSDDYQRIVAKVTKIKEHHELLKPYLGHSVVRNDEHDKKTEWNCCFPELQCWCT